MRRRFARKTIWNMPEPNTDCASAVHSRRLVILLQAILAVLLSIPSVGHSQAQLLGIPFGTPVDIKQCPTRTERARSMCWLDTPFLHKPSGTRIGHVHLPNPDQRPLWAAYGLFRIHQDAQGRVTTLRLTDINIEKKFEVSHSISQRFGNPTENHLSRAGASWASWQSREGHVRLECLESCTTEFLTPAAHAELQDEQRKRRELDAARPKAP